MFEASKKTKLCLLSVYLKQNGQKNVYLAFSLVKNTKKNTYNYNYRPKLLLIIFLKL